MSESSFLSLIAALPLGFLAIVARWKGGSWLAPGAFFALYWSVETIVPILFAWKDEVRVGVVVWIWMACLVVFVGDLVGSSGTRGRRASTVRFNFSPSQVRFLFTAVIACTILGMGAGVSALLFAGYGIAETFRSPDALAAVAHEFSVGRYTEVYTPPLLSQAFLVFVSTAPLFGGMLAAIARSRFHLLATMLTIVPAILITVTQTRRNVTLIAMVLWISGYMATRLLLGDRKVFTKERITFMLLALIALVLLSVGAGLIRLGTTDTTQLVYVMPKVYGAVFGHMVVFSDWIQRSGLDVGTPTLGGYTFAGPFNALGLRERLPGLFTERVLMYSGEFSNIYTAFRPLIQDFTAPGALVVLFLVGFISGKAYRQVDKGKINSIPVLAVFYTSVLYSFVTSIWIYNSVIAAFVMFWVALWLMRRFSKSRNPSASDRAYVLEARRPGPV